MHTSPYVGNDFASADAAWEALLQPMHLRVSTSELQEQDQGLTSVDLPNGGQLAWLGVFHELHCVKVLRKMNYREHYHGNLTAEKLEDLQAHVDHCIDQLREASMCRADTQSLTTFMWEKGYPKPLLSTYRPKHTCIKWDTLINSVRPRVVLVDEVNQCSNPQAGS